MNKHVRRFDIGTLSGAHKTSQGYLKAPALATRTGVFKYRQADGSVRRELRPASEVFNEDSLKSLSGVPLTNEHPTKLLDHANTKEHLIGFTGDSVKADGDHVSVPITITDGNVVRDVEAGKKREVSCGYTCDLVNEPGVHEDGEPYDYVQKNIVYNHLAIVTKGRAGPQARINLDSEDGVMVNPEGEIQMEKLDLDGTVHEVSPELATAIKKHIGAKDKHLSDMKKSHDDVSKSMDALKAENDDMKGKMKSVMVEGDDKVKKDAADLSAVQARLDGVTEELKAEKAKTSHEAIHALVEARAKLAGIAKTAGVQKLDGLSDIEIKKAVIAAKSKVDLTDKSEAYIDARFDHICEGMAGAATGSVIEALNPKPKGQATKNDSQELPDLEAIRKARMDEDREAYKTSGAKKREDVMAKINKKVTK